MNETTNENKKLFIKKIKNNIRINNEQIHDYLARYYEAKKVADNASLFEKLITEVTQKIKELGFKKNSNKELTEEEILNLEESVIDVNDENIINEILLKINKVKIKKRLKNILFVDEIIKNYKYHSKKNISVRDIKENCINQNFQKDKYYILDTGHFSDDIIYRNKQIIQKLANNLFINVLQINAGAQFIEKINNLPCKLLRINVPHCHCHYNNSMFQYLPNSIEKLVLPYASSCERVNYNNSLIEIDYNDMCPGLHFIKKYKKYPWSLQKIHFYSGNKIIKISLLSSSQSTSRTMEIYDDYNHKSSKFYPELLNKYDFVVTRENSFLN
jgi:hypothetical protein